MRISPDSAQENDSQGKCYYCELAADLIQNVTQNKALHPYMANIIKRYGNGIAQLKKMEVGKLDYQNLKNKKIGDNTYEVVDPLELPNERQIADWPIALSLEIDEEKIQKKLANKYTERMSLERAFRNLSYKARKDAEEIYRALG